MTRKIREDDINREYISKDKFKELQRIGEIKVVNELYGNLYGASEYDLLKSLNSSEHFILDFSIHNYEKISRYNPINIIVTVGEYTELHKRIIISKREERTKEILNEYNKYYSNEKLKKYEQIGFSIIINHYNNTDLSLKKINQIIKNKIG